MAKGQHGTGRDKRGHPAQKAVKRAVLKAICVPGWAA
jgi:hypothetical protein